MIVSSRSTFPVLKRPRSSFMRAFTLVELLIVIGIIAVLIAILMPAFAKAKEIARRTNCLSNMRQLTMAWTMYANQNQDTLVSSETMDGAWVTAGNTPDTITQGTLYPFVSNSDVYRCPSDFNLVNVRSYSINAIMNGATGLPAVAKLSEIKHPTDTFVFVEEYDPRGYNEGSFMMLNSGDEWIDFPAFFHDNGTCLSFADGHAEYYKWSDPRTWQITTNYVLTPNDPDLVRLQAIVGY